MRARDSDRQGYVDHHRVKLGFEVFGDGEPTLLLMPTGPLSAAATGRRRCRTCPATSAW
jgi:hypothetical protein